MRNLLLVGFALLAACGPADGYSFKESEFRRDNVTVDIVAYENVRDLRDAAKDLQVEAGKGRELWAFGIVSAKTNRCTIHIVDPAADYRPEWIGHELTHCMRGRWHGGNDVAPGTIMVPHD